MGAPHARPRTDEGDPVVNRADIAFLVWATLAAIYCLIAVGFSVAAAYLEVTH